MQYSWQAQVVSRCGGGHISGQAQYFVGLEVWTRKFSRQAQGIVRLQVVVGGEGRCDIGIGM